MVVFVAHCYQPKLNYRKEKAKVFQVSKQAYKQMYSKVSKEAKMQVKHIEPYMLAVHMRSKMELTKHLQFLIFGSCKSLSYSSADFAMNKVNEYVLLKKIIRAVSLPTGICTDILKCLMEELKMISKIKALTSVDDKIMMVSTKVF